MYSAKPDIYAIDFGTSNTLIAASNKDQVFPPIAIDTGNDPQSMKSVIYVSNAGDWYFGHKAIEHYSEEFGEGRLLRSLKKYLPDPHFSGTTINNKFYSLHDLVSHFLRELKEKADATYNCDVRRVVLGRPALYSLNPGEHDVAVNRMRAAALQAGFSECDFCPEPVAAAAGFRHQLTKRQNVVIADFGGGTSDFSVIKLGPEAMQPEDVLSIGGIHLAGDAFDGKIMQNDVCQHFGSEVTFRVPMGSNDLRFPRSLLLKMCHPADLSMLGRGEIMKYLKDVYKLRTSSHEEQLAQLFVLLEENYGYKLFAEIEKAKIQLSKQPEAFVSFKVPGINIHQPVESARFEKYSKPLVDSIMAIFDQTIAQSGLSYSDCDIVCLTGGTAQLPMIQTALAERFGNAKLTQFEHFKSVISGLADYGRELLRK